jgi:hypothetical protein
MAIPGRWNLSVANRSFSAFLPEKPNEIELDDAVCGGDWAWKIAALRRAIAGQLR